VCLALLALDAVPGWRLVLAANRDEHHERPAEPLEWWPDRPDIVGGRDALAGGTWLAARRAGRFAAVLNDARRPPPRDAGSRGALVPEALGGPDPATIAARVHASRRRDAGFHLLLGEPGTGWYCGTHCGQPRSLPAGMHAVGNAGPDPREPRLARGVELFRTALSGGVSTDALLEALADRSDPGAGEGDCRPVFIADERFGTRCSTVLLVGEDGHACMHERRFLAGGHTGGETIREWRIAPAGGSA